VNKGEKTLKELEEVFLCRIHELSFKIINLSSNQLLKKKRKLRFKGLRLEYLSRELRSKICTFLFIF